MLFSNSSSTGGRYISALGPLVLNISMVYSPIWSTADPSFPSSSPHHLSVSCSKSWSLPLHPTCLSLSLRGSRGVLVPATAPHLSVSLSKRQQRSPGPCHCTPPAGTFSCTPGTLSLSLPGGERAAGRSLCGTRLSALPHGRIELCAPMEPKWSVHLAKYRFF